MMDDAIEVIKPKTYNKRNNILCTKPNYAVKACKFHSPKIVDQHYALRRHGIAYKRTNYIHVNIPTTIVTNWYSKEIYTVSKGHQLTALPHKPSNLESRDKRTFRLTYRLE